MVYRYYKSPSPQKHIHTTNSHFVYTIHLINSNVFSFWLFFTKTLLWQHRVNPTLAGVPCNLAPILACYLYEDLVYRMYSRLTEMCKSCDDHLSWGVRWHRDNTRQKPTEIFRPPPTPCNHPPPPVPTMSNPPPPPTSDHPQSQSLFIILIGRDYL